LLLGFGGFTELRLKDATRVLGEVLDDSPSAASRPGGAS
jgi:hypothetical protein